MKKSGLVLLIMGISLYAENQINLRGTVVAYVNTQLKQSSQKNSTNKELLLETNKKDLTIALTNKTLGSSILLNHNFVNKEPVDLSNKAYFTPTKVGEVIISSTHKQDILCVTIAVK